MKSLEALREIKERALARQKMAGESVRARVTVAMGTCGIAAGARDTMTAILAELERRQVRDVVVTQTGCMGLCEFEPIVQVQVGDAPAVIYGKVNEAKGAVLVEKHVVGGEAVSEWQIQTAP